MALPSKPLPRHKTLERLLKDSAERVKKMTPRELRKMLRRQNKSWTRQDYD